MRKLGRTTRKLDKVRMLIHEITQKLYPFLYDNTHVLINISGILSRQCIWYLSPQPSASTISRFHSVLSGSVCNTETK
jgi:hypothetical protein